MQSNFFSSSQQKNHNAQWKEKNWRFFSGWWGKFFFSFSNFHFFALKIFVARTWSWLTYNWFSPYLDRNWGEENAMRWKIFCFHRSGVFQWKFYSLREFFRTKKVENVRLIMNDSILIENYECIVNLFRSEKKLFCWKLMEMMKRERFVGRILIKMFSKRERHFDTLQYLLIHFDTFW